MFIVIIEPLPIVLFVLPYFKWNSTFFLIKIVNLTRTLSEEDSENEEENSIGSCLFSDDDDSE